MNPGSLSCIQMAVFAITAEFYNESRFTLMHSDDRTRDYCTRGDRCVQHHERLNDGSVMV